MLLHVAREVIRRYTELGAAAHSLPELLVCTADLLIERVGADRVTVRWGAHAHTAVRTGLALEGPPPVLQVTEQGVCSGEEPLPLPICESDCERASIPPALHAELRRSRVRSLVLLGLSTGSGLNGYLTIEFVRTHTRFLPDDVFAFEQIGSSCSLLCQLIETRTANGHGEVRAQYDRLVQHGNVLVLRTDPQFGVRAIRGATETILGASASDLLRDRRLWNRYLNSEDFVRLSERVRSMQAAPTEFSEEVRVYHRRSGAERWLFMRAFPLLDDEGTLLGWEGLGIDITERRQVQEELRLQSRRIEALYTVARALQCNMEPAVVTLRGLRAVISATNSECGIGFLYDRNVDHLELVAAEGVSPAYIKAIQEVINEKSLVRYAIAERQGVLVANLQEDPRAAVETARIEGLRSCIVVPLMVDDAVLGAIAIFCRKPGRYGQDDYELVTAAASQISLAALQAEFYASQKRQANSFATLYRLSHELARRFDPREIAEHVFPIIQEEIAAKRLWLGVISERGSALVGQAGFGPGVRRRLIEARIDLSTPHPFLDQALQTHQPVIVRAGELQGCPDLHRLFERLQVGTVILVPLVSLGRVIGLLAVEPAIPSVFFSQSKLPLLSSMASEIAAVITARRFESRVAEADKMRMAGLLASGVAHNFNNMLQAVMGQASLIQMQAAPKSPAGTSAALIIDAANRGASLVRQLLSFSRQESGAREKLDVREFLVEAEELYRSVIGGRVRLELDVEPGSATVTADEGMLQQVFTNLIVNARDALAGVEQPTIRISSRRVAVAAGEIDPELAAGRYVRVDVQDNGHGMDDERLRRCFEPFFTTKDVDAATGLGFTGTGLGLSSAYSIIRQHEGLIVAESTVGKGTVFSVYLPLVETAPKAAASSVSLRSQVEVVRERAPETRSAAVSGVTEEAGEEDDETEPV